MAQRKSPRIIAGKYKGRRLSSVPGTITRPITDRVKENLFNILGPDIVGTRFLDAFAGTGSVGIEALSRGADYTLFIEKNRSPFDVLNKNLAIIKGENFDVIRDDALKWIEKFEGEGFDFLFIAPPQYHGVWLRAIAHIENNPVILKNDGRIIVQIDPKEFQEFETDTFKILDKRKYGNTLLLFLTTAI